MSPNLHETPSDSPAPLKRSKPSHDTPIVDPAANLPFAAGLLEPANVQRLADAHATAEPYHYCVVKELLEKDFVREARREIVEELAYRAKETDIYKINQSGDLSNISGLPPAELAQLPSLHRLRDALYSSHFRNFIRSVTGCGPLSGIKFDMACNLYEEGCYLLTHDDVIGTRRISFILYLPCEEPEWQPEWGGALELYPIAPIDPAHPNRPNVPTAKPTVSLPPAFNQFAFFVVTPGYSFHSVEEVVVEGDGKKGGVGTRVSLQGWFHAPVEGEEGYEGEAAPTSESTLQQIYSMTLAPSQSYIEPPIAESISPSSLPLLNPAYLSPSLQSHLRTKFIADSHLLLSSFLAPHVAEELASLITTVDATTNATRSRSIGGFQTHQIPSHSTGESPSTGWTLSGPPHLQRFLSFTPPPTPTDATTRLEVLISEILSMLHSPEFRSVLSSLTSLTPTSHATYARRFRPGLDYTLARGDSTPRLDVSLGLTCLTNFVKYVAGKAPGSRWDVGGEWEIADDDDEEEGVQE
ncbi:hypothetical protein RQP46_002889 [Phenoliferia psychrophenolica]